MIEIKTGDVPCCVYVSEVSGHTLTKNKILSSIKNHGSYGIHMGDKNLGQSIFNTDWHLFNAFYSKNSEYTSIINNITDNHTKALTQFLGYTSPITCANVWFQQYKKNDFHGWHRHGKSIFSNVYYVDLPYNASKTSFRFLGKEFTVDVKEGQILTFPSFLEHCSKPNPSDNIKTVVSFNYD